MSPLVDIADTTYQMQTWSPAEYCTCGMDWNTTGCGHKDGCPHPTTTWAWEPMENGTASARWKPKRDAREAVKQAARWAGGVFGISIPAMQVVELPSGRVIWRNAVYYPAAGESIAPPWQDEVYAAARAAHAAERADLADTGRTPDRPQTTGQQEVLF